MNNAYGHRCEKKSLWKKNFHQIKSKKKYLHFHFFIALPPELRQLWMYILITDVASSGGQCYDHPFLAKKMPFCEKQCYEKIISNLYNSLNIS
jgi:hypothetical protein